MPRKKGREIWVSMCFMRLLAKSREADNVNKDYSHKSQKDYVHLTIEQRPRSLPCIAISKRFLHAPNVELLQSRRPLIDVPNRRDDDTNYDRAEDNCSQ